MRLQYTLGASALLLFLTACGGPQTARMTPAEPASASTAQKAGEANVSAKVRLDRALSYLQVGDDYNARQEVEAVLVADPNNALAKSLMDQIDGDPLTTLGSHSFDYTVKSGETLSVLAGRFLDDPLKFYALARYNRIPNPSLVDAGEVIRIPGGATVAEVEAVNTMPAPAAGPTHAPAASAPAAAAAPAPSAAARMQQVEHTFERAPAPVVAAAPAAAPAHAPSAAMAAATVVSGDCASTLPALEAQVKASPTDNIRAQLVKCYSEEADALTQAGRYDEAQRTLQKALMVDHTNTTITQQLVALVSTSRMEALYQKGVAQVEGGKLEEANATLEELLAKDPGNARAQQLQLEVRNKLADRYNSMAMSLFNRNQMDRALALWDRVLQLNPEHQQALEYSAKARAATN